MINTIINILLLVFLLVILGGSTLSALALQTSSVYFRWLRRFYWVRAKRKIAEGIHDYKVQTYFWHYLDKSVAVREYFLNHGLNCTKFILIGKLEELERFVEKFKYNTFDNLDDDEIDFIDNFNKKKK